MKEKVWLEESFKKCLVKAPSAFSWVVAEFPPPPLDECININMMPILIAAGPDALPINVRRYFPLIQSLRIPKDEHNIVMYLSVHESWVEPLSTQRRSGLHVEAPGVIENATVTKDHGYWGNGFAVYHVPQGGIYFGSNISD